MQRYPELEKLVAAWFEAASRGDTSLVDRHVSPSDGTRLVGSDPSEVFQGGSAVAAVPAGRGRKRRRQGAFALNEAEAFSEGTSAGQRPPSRSRCPTGRT